MNRFGSVPIDEPEVYPRSDLPDLIANVLGYQRCLRIVEDDALLVIKPARRLIDLRHDCVHSKRKYAISQGAM
jgi:hypothetical protein